MPPPGVFDVLLEHETAAPRCALEEEYGAALLIADGHVAVNFVSTIDGIVSFGPSADDSRRVGGGVPADRTLMAMLRAVAGVIVVGAGTLRAAGNHQWTPEALLPERPGDLHALRAAAAMPPTPAPLVVVSRSGRLPPDVAAIARPATAIHVLSAAGLDVPQDDAGGCGPGPPSRLHPGAVLSAAAGLAPGPVLCEGGPHLLGTLLEASVTLDLFLTLAPQLAGREGASRDRLSLVEGIALPPFARPAAVRSVRRSGSHLLLRYNLSPA